MGHREWNAYPFTPSLSLPLALREPDNMVRVGIYVDVLPGGVCRQSGHKLDAGANRRQKSCAGQNPELFNRYGETRRSPLKRWVVRQREWGLGHTHRPFATAQS